MAVTADNSTLIVADSYKGELTAFEIATDGSLNNRRTWADLGDHNPDGICIDAEATVWYADVPHRCCVRVREGGERLETIEVDRGCFACMLGGPDGSTLFILAQEWRGPAAIGAGSRTGQVLAVEAPAPHAGWP
jgi:sugar lactone lactonase YvrE